MATSPAYPLHVTRALLNRARLADFRFGDDTALVAVQHMLLQTIDLFTAAGAMGLNLNNAFALGKVYSNSPPVIETLRKMGITVVDSTAPGPGEFYSYFQRDVARLWQVAAETLASRRVNRILVLDDAGRCITSVPRELRRQYRMCGVEQTSQGTFLFEQQPPAMPVISWARSAVKLRIGGPIFANSFIEKLSTEFLDGHSLQGKQLGVIGLGSIGSAVAKLAVRCGMKVLFYDPACRVQAPCPLRGLIERANSLEQLMLTSDYVAGCSGHYPFQNKWPLPHKPQIKLLSASGGDQEFGPIINDLKTKPGFEIDPESWTITSRYGPSGPLQIAYLGYPYNFVSRAPEAVPTRVVQLETGGLLAALVQAKTHLQATETNSVHDGRLYRVAPAAQRFVYETWRHAMEERGKKLAETFAYDAEMLAASQHDEWFSENTDPPENEDSKAQAIEESMVRFFRQPRAVSARAER